MTWASLWWRVGLLARMEMRRIRGAWLVWRRHHRKARRTRIAHGVIGRPGSMLVPWQGEAAWQQLGLANSSPALSQLAGMQNTTGMQQAMLQQQLGGMQNRGNPYAGLGGQPATALLGNLLGGGTLYPNKTWLS